MKPLLPDISPDFKQSDRDTRIIREIIRHAETPMAIQEFSRRCGELTSYSYWFLLGTLWVSYSGHSDINLWRSLFSSPRKNRETSIMKPSELRAFRSLPDTLFAYRAHRLGETDWIAYTLSDETAGWFACERGTQIVSLYAVRKADVVALFLRRGESEIIMLHPSRAEFVRTMPVIVETPGEAHVNSR